MAKIHKLLTIDLNKPAPDIDRLIAKAIDLKEPIADPFNANRTSKADRNSVKIEPNTYGKETGKNGSIIDRVKALGIEHGVDLIFADPYRL